MYDHFMCFLLTLYEYSIVLFDVSKNIIDEEEFKANKILFFSKGSATIVFRFLLSFIRI